MNFRQIFFVLICALPGIAFSDSLSLGNSVSDAVNQDSHQHNSNVGNSLVTIVEGISEAAKNAENIDAETSSKANASADNIGTSPSAEVVKPEAGVKSIERYGRVSGTNKIAQLVTCNNGEEWRIWRSNGQWWDGRGAQGGNYRSLNEQAAFLCE